MIMTRGMVVFSYRIYLVSKLILDTKKRGTVADSDLRRVECILSWRGFMELRLSDFH